MTDTVLLKQKIKESGYKISYIAEKLGLSYPGLKKKIDNQTDFRAGEIQTLSDLLCLSVDEKEAIFFCA